MELDTDLSNINESNKSQNYDSTIVSKVISIINTGRSILFTGAGFSLGCENVFNESPPLANELAKLISKKAEIAEDEDLSYVSDYYLNHKNRDDLVQLLKNHYTISVKKYIRYINKVYKFDEISYIKRRAEPGSTTRWQNMRRSSHIVAQYYS